MTRHLLNSLVTLATLCAPLFAGAQGMAINTTGASADQSAVLDVSSASQGVLVPRMTTAQRRNINQPATGLLIYQNDSTTGFYYNSGTPASPSWIALNVLANSGVTANTYGSSTAIPVITVDATGRVTCNTKRWWFGCPCICN
jgi:hypothetical protein